MATAPTTEHDIVPDGTGAIVETTHEQAVFPPFDSTTFASQLLWLAITFILLYWLMAKVIIPRISGILGERQARIAADIEKAERARTDSEAALAAYEKALSTARASATSIAEEARNAAKAQAETERKATEASLAEKLAAAEARIGDIKSKALADVSQIAGDAAESIVKALVGSDVARKDVDDAVAGSMKGGADVR